MKVNKTVKKLSLYMSDIYSKKITIFPQKENFVLKKRNNIIIQTDAICQKRDKQKIVFINYNFVLVREFSEHINVSNELYYNIDSLKNKGLDVQDLFPIYPNSMVLNYYLNYCDVSEKTKKKCLNYLKNVNKQFYK